jgi:hypothetical protein
MLAKVGQHQHSGGHQHQQPNTHKWGTPTIHCSRPVMGPYCALMLQGQQEGWVNTTTRGVGQHNYHSHYSPIAEHGKRSVPASRLALYGHAVCWWTIGTRTDSGCARALSPLAASLGASHDSGAAYTCACACARVRERASGRVGEVGCAGPHRGERDHAEAVGRKADCLRRGHGENRAAACAVRLHARSAAATGTAAAAAASAQALVLCERRECVARHRKRRQLPHLRACVRAWGRVGRGR